MNVGSILVSSNIFFFIQKSNISTSIQNDIDLGAYDDVFKKKKNNLSPFLSTQLVHALRHGNGDPKKLTEYRFQSHPFSEQNTLSLARFRFPFVSFPIKSKPKFFIPPLSNPRTLCRYLKNIIIFPLCLASLVLSC